MAARGNNQGKGTTKFAYAPAYAHKHKIPPPPKKGNPSKDVICHQCGEIGYPNETMGYSFYYPPENKVLVAQNDEFFENSLITQKASRSLEDLEIIQDEDTHPSENTSLCHDEDNQEIDEPQIDLLPNGKTIGSKWLFKKKTDMDGNSTKQSILATSLAKAEYIAALNASKQAVWVRKFIFRLGVVPKNEEPMKMFCDNTRAVTIANEPVITKGARHYRTCNTPKMARSGI
nr:retrovirus-related Pol polyprotein from transposon TNT 1-94 [Tanacetum cinerariifolium]